MKLLLLLFFLPLVNSDLSSLRSLYQEASKDEAKANKLLVIADKNSSNNSVFYGYKGAAKIIMAKYAFNPYTKWNLFNEGKDILESAIASDVNNVELTYLRLTIQMNAPNFLGYKSNIDSDKKFLKENINGLNDKELQSIIKNYLLKI
jgi:hypothetical protein